MPSYSSRRRRLVFVPAVRGNFSIPWSRSLIFQGRTSWERNTAPYEKTAASGDQDEEPEDSGAGREYRTRQGGYHVSAELLRKHVSEMCSDRLSGRQGGSLERLYVFPRGLLQVRDMRYQAHPEDLLQQSAHD